MSVSLILTNPLVLPPRPKAELEIDIPTLVKKKSPLINNSRYLSEEGRERKTEKFQKTNRNQSRTWNSGFRRVRIDGEQGCQSLAVTWRCNSWNIKTCQSCLLFFWIIYIALLLSFLFYKIPLNASQKTRLKVRKKMEYASVYTQCTVPSIHRVQKVSSE